MAKKEEPKLTVELIPTTCHFSNVRTNIKTTEWDIIRHMVYENALYTCEICSGNGIAQGYKHRVECHEIWQYNDKTKTQKLVGLIALCPLCHQSKHVGRAIAMGRQEIIYKHMRTVNGWRQKTLDKYIEEALLINRERSKYKWLLDIELLRKPPYNIKLKKRTTRKFKKKKIYRRRKRKVKKS